MIDGLTKTLDFNAAALLLRSERGRVLAGNLANADTPNFKARDFNFGQALESATGLQRAAASAPPARTNPGHLAPNGFGSGAPALQYRTSTQAALDGNSVDMDLERAAFADNTVRYEASLRFLNGQIRTLTLAINGQGQS
jgi:flagellar basal-body rod protein FlgB